MNVEAKQYMQLFGEWGYTVPEMIKKTTKLLEKAYKCEDRVGSIAYFNMLGMCDYAQNGDPIKAVCDIQSDKIPKDILEKNETFAKIIDVISEKLFNINRLEYCENVINAMYATISAFHSYEEAVLSMRLRTLIVIGDGYLASLSMTTSNIKRSVLRAIIGVAMTDYEVSRIEAFNHEDNKVSVLFDSFTRQLLKYSDTYVRIAPLVDEHSNETAQKLLELGLDDLSNKIKHLSSLKFAEFAKLLPHEMWEVSNDYGDVCLALLVGVACGEISYKQYRDIFIKHNATEDIIDSDSISRIFIERNN